MCGALLCSGVMCGAAGQWGVARSTFYAISPELVYFPVLAVVDLCIPEICLTGARCHCRGDHIRVGKLNLVDLAGSERQSKVPYATMLCRAICWVCGCSRVA
jgi:hypothetical protein